MGKQFVWRPTYINAFLQCPKKFYHEFYLPAKTNQTLSSPTKPFFILGQAVHKVLEVGLKDGLTPAKEIFNKLLPNIPEEKQDEYKHMEKNIYTFIENFKARTDIVTFKTERKFEFPQWNLQGTADLVVVTKDSSIEIVDHKTNKYHRVEEYMERQLLLYSFFALQEIKEKGKLDLVKKVKTAVHFVRYGDTIPVFELPPEQVISNGKDFLLKFIDRVKEQIDRGWEPRPGWYCRFCSVKECFHNHNYTSIDR
jgi:hypothetical protein